MTRLTGTTRYRTGFLGVVILQVQESVTVDEDVGYGMGTHSSQYLRWRDARVQDLTILNMVSVEV